MPVELPDDYDPRPTIESLTWRYAVSLPRHPHSYSHVRTCPDREAFMRMVQWLNATGERRTFAGHAYKYRSLEGYTYWVSSAPSGLMLNRRRTEDVTEPIDCPRCGSSLAAASGCDNCRWTPGADPVPAQGTLW